MGSVEDYVPIRSTRAFREAQSDENFQSWLKMQEAAIPLVFELTELPGVAAGNYSADILPELEARLLERFDSNQSMWQSDSSTTLGMQYTYVLGEIFRRSFEGTWIAFPQDSGRPGLLPAVDVPFREEFVQPVTIVRFALNRRTGDEAGLVYSRARRRYDDWVLAGRPDRVVRGTLREAD